MAAKKRNVWLDSDPGHDDAIAMLIACHCENINLLGISTVHGNAAADLTLGNALRLLYAFAAPDTVHVHPGALKPLLRPARPDPEIHGEDGLGGVEGLPDAEHPGVRDRFLKGGHRRAIEGMAKALQATWNSGQGEKVTFVTTGPMTNLALFVSAYPDLVPGIEEIVFMGGAVGLGNRSAVAEYNILCDPEAAQIVLDVPVPKVMIPINVSHTTIFTKQIHSRLLCPTSLPVEPLPSPSTPLRYTLSTLLTFFMHSYKSTFGFEDGPPLHDALTIGYIAQPSMFQLRRRRVDVELAGSHTAGETVVDIWNYRDTDNTWGTSGKNCLVAERVDVPNFFELFLACVEKCDKVSPLNR